jgi:hypothetical protein
MPKPDIEFKLHPAPSSSWKAAIHKIIEDALTYGIVRDAHSPDEHWNIGIGHDSEGKNYSAIVTKDGVERKEGLIWPILPEDKDEKELTPERAEDMRRLCADYFTSLEGTDVPA